MIEAPFPRPLFASSLDFLKFFCADAWANIDWSESGSQLWPLRRVELLNSGDVKGTITNALRYHFVPNDVRRHRLISISYVSLLPSHGRARWYGRERAG